MVVGEVAHAGGLVVIDVVARDVGSASVHAVLEGVLGFLFEIGGSVPFAAVNAESFTPRGRVALAIAWD